MLRRPVLNLVLCLLLAAPAAAQTTRPSTRPLTRPATAATAPVPASELMQWVGLGGGGGHLRQMPPGLLEGGYRAVDRGMVRPAVAVGCKYILFHCPGGTTGKTGEFAGMTWDQFVLCEEEPGLPPFIRAAEFVKTFAPYHKQGVRFGVYLGNPLWSPDLKALRDKGDYKAWSDRFRRSLQPVLDLKADLYVDALSEITLADHPLEYFSMRWAEQQVKAYGGKMVAEEAYFCWNTPDWKDQPGFTAWPLRSDRPVPAGKWCVMFDQFETVGKDPDIVRRMVDLGYVPAVNVWEYAKATRPRRR
jgi:hypothetical protein